MPKLAPAEAGPFATPAVRPADMHCLLITAASNSAETSITYGSHVGKYHLLDGNEIWVESFSLESSYSRTPRDRLSKLLTTIVAGSISAYVEPPLISQ